MRDYRELLGEAGERGAALARDLYESGAPLRLDDDGPIADLLARADQLPGWVPGDAGFDVRATFRCQLENVYGDLLFESAN